MRSDWQTHCLVITVWWTFIVFRLVETETCCALACCTNANLFHVDIISHCLLSNHNTCLTFLYNESVLPRVYFILAARIYKRRRGLKGHRQGLLVWSLCVTLYVTCVELMLHLYFPGNVDITIEETDALEATVAIACLIYCERWLATLFLGQ